MEEVTCTRVHAKRPKSELCSECSDPCKRFNDLVHEIRNCTTVIGAALGLLQNEAWESGLTEKTYKLYQILETQLTDIEQRLNSFTTEEEVQDET